MCELSISVCLRGEVSVPESSGGVRTSQLTLDAVNAPHENDGTDDREGNCPAEVETR